jgi:predicted acetyltransferase
MLYKVKNRIMDIGEMAYADESARRGLWRFIASHDSMCDKIKLQAPADDSLPFLLPDPRIVQSTVPYFTARIVDFRGFVEQYAFEPTGREESVRIRLGDRQAPWNDGDFVLRADGAGAGSAEAAGDDAAAFAPELACDIQTMTAMLMGYKRPRFMRDVGRLSGGDDAVERLERIVPARATYFPDYF